MPGRLTAEIRQSQPFEHIEVEAFRNLVRTAMVLERRVAEALKPFGISPTQYNFLRILRGAGAAGLKCSEAAARMVRHDPDITRLVDRLKARRLVERRRRRADRRAVMVRITRQGLARVEAATAPLVQLQVRQMGRLSRRNLRRLIALLERLREPSRLSAASDNRYDD